MSGYQAATTLLYSSCPPNMSRALPIVRSTFPWPKARTLDERVRKIQHGHSTLVQRVRKMQYSRGMLGKTVRKMQQSHGMLGERERDAVKLWHQTQYRNSLQGSTQEYYGGYATQVP